MRKEEYKRANMMVKKLVKYTAVALSCIVLNACHNKDNSADENQELDDSLTAAHSVKGDDSAKIFDNKGAINFVQNFSSKKLKWKRFHLQAYGIDLNEKGKPENFVPEKNFYKEYASVLKYSPNKKHILDLNSDNLIPVKNANGKTVLEGGDPETEISLINVVNKKRTKLLFFGPDSEIITGEWLSNDEVAIVGTVPTVNNKMDTLMHVINIKTFFTRTYKYKK